MNVNACKAKIMKPNLKDIDNNAKWKKSVSDILKKLLEREKAQAANAPTSTIGNGQGVALSSSATQLAVGQLPSVQQLPQIRDPEWLKLEVCREFQRGACKRSAEECKYAHPPKNVQIMPDGKVIACFDALKRRCSRETCKYLHPPDHLKQQLEINGRNNLIQQRAMLQMLPLQQTILQAQTMQPPTMQVTGASSHPTIMNSLPATPLYNHSAAAVAAANNVASHAYPVYQPDLTLNSPLLYYPATLGAASGHTVNLASPTPALSAQHLAGRADRLEVCRDFQRNNCNRGEHECRYAHPEDRSMIDQTDNTVTVCMDCIKGRCTRDKCKYFHPPAHLQAKIKASQHQPFGNTIQTPQQAVMSLSQGQSLKRQLVLEDMINNNGQPIGQPPIKRHALETTKVGTTTSPTLNVQFATTNGVHPHQMYNYIPYYQHVPVMPMYGHAPSAATPIPSPGLPTGSLQTETASVNPASSTFAILNAQNQATALTVCRDFQSGKCNRPFCRFVHVSEDHVEVKDDKVTVCVDALNGKCTQANCKFYHYPSSENNSEISNPPQGFLPHNIAPVMQSGIMPSPNNCVAISNPNTVGSTAHNIFPNQHSIYQTIVPEALIHGL